MASPAHFPPAVAAGADAVLAASVFHFGVLRIRAVKEALRDAGYPVRLSGWGGGIPEVPDERECLA